MNDKDKEAFEKYMGENMPYDYYHHYACRELDTWQAAIEYKQKEIDDLNKMNMFQESHRRIMGEKLEKLQSENAKLRECLEFTTHAAEYLYKPDVKLNKGMTPTFYFTLTYEGDLELMEKTKRARQVLKELENK